MKPLLLLAFFLFLLTAGFAQIKPKGLDVKDELPVGTERRIALVIGNKDYMRFGRLTNPLNDARDMAAALRRLGFTVIEYQNLKRAELETVIDDFTEKLTRYDVGLFYFSGHGLGIGGQSYLVPIDANMSYDTQVNSQCVSLRRMLDGMEGARDAVNSANKVNLVLLDACRNNPLLTGLKKDGSGTGLILPTNAPGCFVAFATRDGRPALDFGNDTHSLFTDELLKHLNQPNVGIRSMLDRTIVGVRTHCQRNNVPKDQIPVPGRYDELEDDFVFVQTRKEVIEPAKPVVVEPRRTPPVVVDLPPFMDMVAVAGGTFDMGSNDGQADEKPVHAVTVSGFQMGKYEVTVAQFAQFVAAEKYKTDAEKIGSSRIWSAQKSKWIDSTGITWRCGVSGALRPAVEYNHPVVHVSHNDAVAFCAWLTKREGRVHRLPTEAEWEFAARGGAKSKGYKFAGGNDPNVVGWTGENSGDNTHGVGEKAANELGLYDLTGNVWEWCSDWYDKDYYSVSSGSVNPTGPSTTGTYRVIRGGSWYDAPTNCRTAYRYGITPADRTCNVGFRVVSQ